MVTYKDCDAIQKESLKMKCCDRELFILKQLISDDDNRHAKLLANSLHTNSQRRVFWKEVKDRFREAFNLPDKDPGLPST